MAIFKNDPFPGTDYTQFLKWKKIVTPSGQVLYVVPGNEAYVYDPVASNATGRKVFRTNPQQAITEAEEQKAAQEKAQKQAEFNSSPTGQLLPVAAGTAGLIAASKWGAPAVAPSAVQMLPGGGVLMSDGAIKGGTAAAQALSGSPTVANAAAQGAQLQAPNLVGVNSVAGAPVSAATEGTMGAAPGIGYAPYLGLAGAGLGAYGLYNAIEANDEKSGALSGAGLGLGLGAAAPLVGMGPLGWGGLAAAAALGGLGGFGLTNVFGHKSTRDVAKEHTGDLLNVGQDDATYQNYVKGIREQHNYAPPDPSKPFHGGQYASWDEYERAGLDAADLTGVYGNIKAYGPQWASLTEDQRRAVTQANIESGLYKSKKGEVELTDEAKALENFQNVMKGFQVGAKEGVKAATTPQAAPTNVVGLPRTPAEAAAQGAALPPRSNTTSPGMLPGGIRIYYK